MCSGQVPELKIVSPELWNAVKKQRNEIRQKSAYPREVLNNPQSLSRSWKFLFSELLECCCCGAFRFNAWPFQFSGKLGGDKGLHGGLLFNTAKSFRVFNFSLNVFQLLGAGLIYWPQQ